MAEEQGAPAGRILYEIFEHGIIDRDEREVQNFEPWPVQSASGTALAVISGCSVSIFREEENFETPHGPFEDSRPLMQAQGGPLPQATHACWTPEGSERDLLAVAFSPGFVHVIDNQGEQLAEYARSEWLKAGGVAGVAMRGGKDSGWESTPDKGEMPELLVLGKEALLWRLPVDTAPTSGPLSPLNAGFYRPQIDMRKQHPRGTFCLLYSPTNSTLTVLGPGSFKDGSGQTVPFSVSSWLLTSSAPFHRLLYSAGATPPSRLQILRRPAWTQMKEFPKAVISPDGSYVALLEPSKTLRILNFSDGGQGPVCLLSVGESDVTGDVTGVHDVAWWSEKALLVARSDGSVTVEKLPALENMLGESPEKFGRSASVTHVVKKRAFVLDGLEEETSEDAAADREEQVTMLGRISGWFSQQTPMAAPIKKWRLTSIVERSPSEMMGVHIRHEEYGAALALAKLYALDTDPVYRARWEASDFENASVHDNLSKIKDRRFVLTECVTRAMRNAEAQRELLQFGLQETEKWNFQEREDGWDSLEVPEDPQAGNSESSGDGEAWWFRKKRLQVLRVSDLLATYLVIHNNRYSSEKFAAFKSGSLPDLALQYAQAGSSGPLEVLLKRHNHSLAPKLLEVLDSMPETVVPYSIRGLLPGPEPPSVSLSRRPDWVESEATLSAVKNGSLDLSAEERTEELVRLESGLIWPTGEQLTEWYKARAIAIDAKSGLLENSLYLLTFGADLGVQNLEELSSDVRELYEVIYGGSHFETVDLTLEDWLKKSGFERYCAVMQGATNEDVVERLGGPADRVAQRWGTKDEGTSRGSQPPEEASLKEEKEAIDVTLFPKRWLLQQAEQGKLELVSTAFKAQLQGGVNKPLMPRGEAVELALECIYMCPATDAWDSMADLLGALNVTSAVPTNSPRAQDAGNSREGQESPKAALISAPPGSKRARVAGFLQSAAERAKTQGGVAGFFSRLPKKIGPGKNEEGMADILANLPRKSTERDEFENASESFENPADAQPGRLDDVAESAADVAARERLEKRVQRAEKHVRAGRILAGHQMAQPLRFFLTCEEDPPGAKKLLRRLLAWFSRTNPPDAQWDALWADLSSLQTDAFPFLDTQYLLSEFVRALLRGGRLPLAKLYISGGRKRPPLLEDRAETLVLGAAREYFYSAASLDSVDIQRARECLDLLPTSLAAKGDRDLMEAITKRLPKLGVELLPLQFKQLKDKEEVIQMALAARDRAFLDLPELLNVATLLGLTTSSEQSRIKLLSADAAFRASNIAFALSICIELVDESFQPAWQLAAALGRTLSEISGEQVGVADRKKLLGFAIAHVEGRGMSELLRSWEGIDLAIACEDCLKSGVQGRSFLKTLLGQELTQSSEKSEARQLLGRVSKPSSADNVSPLVAAFAQSYLPGLLKACFSDGGSERNGRAQTEESFEAGMIIYNALGQFGLFANDELLGRLAELSWGLGKLQGERGSKEAVVGRSEKARLSTESFALSCLLEMDSAAGAALVEKEVRSAKQFEEVRRATQLAIHFYGIQGVLLREEKTPDKVENLLRMSTEELLRELRKQSGRPSLRENDSAGQFQQKSLQYSARLAALTDAKRLEEILPGVDVDRFASGDQHHQQELVLSLVSSQGGPDCSESLPPETRTLEEQSAALEKALILAEKYGVDTWRVIIGHVQTLLLSDWSEEEVSREVKEAVAKLSGRETEVVGVLIGKVWPRLQGTRHARLALLFSLMSTLWPKVGSDSQAEVAKAWRLSGAQPSVASVFDAVAAAADTFATSAADVDLEVVIGLFSTAKGHGLLDLLRGHVTLSNADALIEAVRKLEAAYGVETDASASSISLAAIRRRFDDVSNQTSEALAEAYDVSKPLIAKLSAVDLEGLLSDIRRRAYKLSEASEAKQGLALRSRLLQEGSQFLKDAVEVETSESLKERCLRIAETLEEAGGVLREVGNLAEGGQIDGHQAKAAERAVRSWPLDEGKENSRIPAAKALISLGASYEAVERLWGQKIASKDQNEVEGTDRNDGGSPTEGLGALYAEMLQAVLMDSKQEGDAGRKSEFREALDVLLSGLAQRGEEQEGIAQIRLQFWTKLKEYTDSPTAPLKRKIQTLELLNALEEKGTWRTFHAPKNAKDLGAKAETASLLLLRSAEIVENVWPQVTVGDVSRIAACEGLFERLVTSARGGDVSEKEAGALFALLRLWEGHSDAFVSERVGAPEQEKEGGPEEHTRQTIEDVGRQVKAENEQSEKEETKSEAGETDEARRAVESEQGVGEWCEIQPDSKDVKATSAEEPRTLSRFHRCYKLLVSLLLTSSMPRATLVLLDRLSGADVISEQEALELVSEASAEIGHVAAAKLALMLPLERKDERAVELLSSSGGERDVTADVSSDVSKEEEGAEQEGLVGSEDVALSQEMAAARKEFDSVDADLVGLIIAHGLLPRIAHKGGVQLLRALCLALTPLAQDQQQLLSEETSPKPQNPLAAVAFSCFVADLTAVQSYGFAGALVLQYLRVPPALANWDAAPEALLRYLRYLKRKLPQQVRIARNLSRALESESGLSASAYLRSPVEEISRRVLRLSSKALNTLVQDLK